MFANGYTSQDLILIFSHRNYHGNQSLEMPVIKEWLEALPSICHLRILATVIVKFDIENLLSLVYVHMKEEDLKVVL